MVQIKSFSTEVDKLSEKILGYDSKTSLAEFAKTLEFNNLTATQA